MCAARLDSDHLRLPTRKRTHLVGEVKLAGIAPRNRLRSFLSHAGERTAISDKVERLPETVRGNLAFYALVLATGVLAGGVGALFHSVLRVLHHRHELLSQMAAAIAVPGWLLAPIVVAACVAVANGLVRRFAAESAGSGVPAVLQTLHRGDTPRWSRILPVQLVAGLLALGSGLVLGREGPLVHLGSAGGAMMSRCAPLDRACRRSLIVAGAAAGLGAALMAPLAGVVLIFEELREEFDHGFHSLQAVILATVVATVVTGGLFGYGPLLSVPELAPPPVTSLWLCLVLGGVVGAFAVGFNRALVWGLRCFEGLPQRHPLPWSLGMGAMIGAMIWFWPSASGSGEHLILDQMTDPPAVTVILALILMRTALLVASYSTGVPGGIYAPLLALGTLLGLLFGELVPLGWLAAGVEPGVFAVASMGAVFAASVRAPLTGVVVVAELTGTFDLLLAIMITAVSATLTAAALGGRPLFEVLARTRHTSNPTAA